MSDNDPESAIRHYFVDEAGDANFFDAGGRVIAGTQGCSSHFILGVLDVKDSAGLGMRMRLLHDQVRKDAFFAGVESLKPERQKTAVLFHAKDDIDEIRERVFRLLLQEDVRFAAVVRDKRGLAVDVKNRNQQSQTYHYTPNHLYDEMIRRLFKDRLHKDAGYQVYFSKRGSKDRTAALKAALEQAREKFRKQWGIAGIAPIEVSALAAAEHYGLQAVDYFLWALQRAYSTGQDRYIRFLWPKVSLVHDVDDRRNNLYGVYYTAENGLTAEKLKK